MHLAQPVKKKKTAMRKQYMSPAMAIEKIEMDTNLLSASDVNGLGGGDPLIKEQLFDDVETPEEMFGIPGSGFEMKLLGL